MREEGVVREEVMRESGEGGIEQEIRNGVCWGRQCPWGAVSFRGTEPLGGRRCALVRVRW